MKNGGTREAWLDWCRLFAISAIVLTHCVEQFYPLSAIVSKPLLAKLPVLLLFTIGRLGVPVFLFLTGYLLPSRHVIECLDDYRTFVTKKWLPLFICVESWILIYGVVYIIGSENVRWYDVIRWMVFNRSVPLSHWWYMPMIVGAYLGVPLLSVFAKVLGRQFIVCLLVISAFAHVFRSMVHVGFVDLSFVGNCYFTYIIFGYAVYLYRDIVSKCMSMRSIKIGMMCLFAMNLVACLFYQVRGGRMVFIWYSAPCLITAGLMVPILLKVMTHCRSAVVSFVSVSSFGVYLLHNLILKMLHAIRFNISPGWARCVLSWAIAMGASLAIVAIVKRSKNLSRLLFLIK